MINWRANGLAAPRARPAGAARGTGAPASDGDGGSGGAKPPGLNEATLIARDERKNPLLSTFNWTDEATQRIFRVPAGFMRTKTQERIEELARGRGATTIDLALVEQGIEIGKQMMAEMIANYPSPGKSPAPAPAPQAASATDGRGYLNEVSARAASGERRDA